MGGSESQPCRPCVTGCGGAEVQEPPCAIARAKARARLKVASTACESWLVAGGRRLRPSGPSPPSTGMPGWGARRGGGGGGSEGRSPGSPRPAQPETGPGALGSLVTLTRLVGCRGGGPEACVHLPSRVAPRVTSRPRVRLCRMRVAPHEPRVNHDDNSSGGGSAQST